MASTQQNQNPCRCGGLAHQLSAYLDGELPADLCREIEQHVGHCPDCKVVLDTLRRTVQIVHDLASTPTSITLPPSVESRLLARLAGEM